MESKVCTHCKIDKPLSEYDVRFDKQRDQHRICTYCKECRKKKIRAYDKKNRDKKRLYNSQYKEKNRLKLQEAARKYHKDNRDRILAYQRHWRKVNPDKVAEARFSRRDNFQKARPEWLTPEMEKRVEEVYNLARDCRITTGEEYEVDHIIPIKAKGICGLHVPWNLQVLPKDVNRAKSNRYDPDSSIAPRVT